MKKVLSLVLVSILCLIPYTSSYAEVSYQPIAEEYTGLSHLSERPATVDILVENNQLRGISAPTQSHTLPYTASAEIETGVYTNYYFYPNSEGKLYTNFFADADEYTTLRLILHSKSIFGGSAQHDYTTSGGPYYTAQGSLVWSGLNPNYGYYFEIEELGNALVNFTLDIDD